MSHARTILRPRRRNRGIVTPPYLTPFTIVRTKMPIPKSDGPQIGTTTNLYAGPRHGILTPACANHRWVIQLCPQGVLQLNIYSLVVPSPYDEFEVLLQRVMGYFQSKIDGPIRSTVSFRSALPNLMPTPHAVSGVPSCLYLLSESNQRSGANHASNSLQSNVRLLRWMVAS